MLCGRPDKEFIHSENGYGAVVKKGYAWNGWALPVYHCRAGEDSVEVELTVPKEASGIVRICVLDPDSFQG